MFGIIDRYVLKECTLAVFAVLAVLVLILSGNSLVRVLGDIVEGQLPVEVLAPMLGINLIQYLVIVVPLSVYLGILLGLGRLYKDSEMTAMFACGIGTRQLYRPILTLAAGFTLVSALLAMYLAPWSAGEQDRIKHEAEHRSQLSALSAGRFNLAGGGDRTLFFERFQAGRSVMQNVFLYTGERQPATVEMADSAVQYEKSGGATYLVFQNGRAYSGKAGQSDYRITDFSAHGVWVKQESPPVLDARISAADTGQLLRRDAPVYRAELHWRLAVPVACFLLALLALPLSHTSPRKGRFAKLGTGILLYIVYSNLVGLGRTWLERGLVPDGLGLWWVHGLFAIGLAVLLMQREQVGPFAARERKAA